MSSGFKSFLHCRYIISVKQSMEDYIIYAVRKHERQQLKSELILY